jgi:effector-binding domain-containing protein
MPAIHLTSLPAQRVAALRTTLRTRSAVRELIGTLLGPLLAAHTPLAGPVVVIYHDPDDRERDLDVEVAVPVAGPPPIISRIRLRELPAVARMVCLIHEGPLVTLPEGYAALLGWLAEHGYAIGGPVREAYLDSHDFLEWHEEMGRVEIQVPVGRRG